MVLIFKQGSVSLQSLQFFFQELIFVSLMSNWLSKHLVISPLNVQVLLLFAYFHVSTFEFRPELPKLALVKQPMSLLLLTHLLFVSDLIQQLLLLPPQIVSEVFAPLQFSLSAEEGVVFPLQISFSFIELPFELRLLRLRSFQWIWKIFILLLLLRNLVLSMVTLSPEFVSLVK